MGFFYGLAVSNMLTAFFWTGGCAFRFFGYKHPLAILCGVGGFASMTTGVWVLNRGHRKEKEAFALLTANCFLFSLCASRRIRLATGWGRYMPTKMYYIASLQGGYNAYNWYLWHDVDEDDMHELNEPGVEPMSFWDQYFGPKRDMSPDRPKLNWRQA